jgi:hypothetical protein
MTKSIDNDDIHARMHDAHETSRTRLAVQGVLGRGDRVADGRASRYVGGRYLHMLAPS